LLFAFALGLITGIGKASTKTITIETGIQNTGLGLVLIFNFFDGNGAMAIIAAWWGIWHIISGFAISQIFKKYYC
ncbi:MAG: bile acid:sodium symporter family protein, partial [Bacteroidia bacterium]